MPMKKVNLFFSVLITVFFLAVWGCRDNYEADMTGCGGDALCVGVLTPDPSLVSFAEGLEDAALTAETDITNAGGNIKLYVKEVGDCDDYSVPRAAAKELIDMGVNAIVGHICSGVSNSILGGGDEDAVSGIGNVIMLSPSNTAAIFSQDDAIYDLYFRTAPSDVNQARLLAKEIKKAPTAVPTYIVYRDDAWGKLFKEDLLENDISAEEMTKVYDRKDEPDTIAANVEKFLADKEGHINVAVIAFEEAESILKKLLSSEKISDENRYYLADGYYSNLEELKDDLEALGPSNLEDPKTLAQLFQSNSSGFLVTSPDSYEYEDDMELAEAQKDFQSKHEGEYITNTYDAVVLLGLAYLSAGSAEPDALAQALLEISNPPGKCISYEECAMQIQNEETYINYEGLSGRIDFDKNGDIRGAVYKILSYFNRTVEERRNIAP